MATKTATKKLVKIHPFNSQQGYFCRRHIHPPYTFREERGWYEVDAETADVLSKKLNNPNDPHSRPIFLVVTQDEALAIEEREEEVVAAADNPVPLPREVKRTLMAPPPRPQKIPAANDPAAGDVAKTADPVVAPPPVAKVEDLEAESADEDSASESSDEDEAAAEPVRAPRRVKKKTAKKKRVAKKKPRS